MKIVVAGGGLVGLTAAAVLGQDGHDVTVLEQAPEIRAAGAGIGLWANALRVLDTLDIGPTVRGMGSTIRTWFYDPRGERMRAPGFDDADLTFSLVPRAPLNTLLADVIGRDRIRLGARVVGFEEHPDRVDVELSDATTLSADLLLGADGVHSPVRTRLLPGTDAREHEGHHAWRAVIPSPGDEQREDTVLTIGERRTRGGYSHVGAGATMWMINQFDAGPLTGSTRDQALARVGALNANGWQDDLVRMIEQTPDEVIIHNQILYVPRLPRWTGGRVALVGDAAHGLSPHIAAGGTLGIEDVGVLRRCLAEGADLAGALDRYAEQRMPRFEQVHAHADEVEAAADAAQFAESYVAFSHWMLTTAPDS
jgi:2-polyprenyl-6-methoxyphenol hydroxylase-like FAD-dependent oxidoreductase